MDLVAACRVFVHVGERGSFTQGAAAAGVPQPVASRRIAALERHLGARLFDRSTRRAALTAFGRDMIPPATRLVRLADELSDHAALALLRPLSVAVPETCSVRRLAQLDAAAREDGTVLEFRTATPAGRAELLNAREVRLALLATPVDEATWVVPLGVASTVDEDRPLRVETLRPSRTRREPRRLWVQPEDDVPHVRDRLTQLGNRAALLPAQIAVAPSLTSAVSDVLRSPGNLLLCPSGQAEELGLRWRPLAGVALARGYVLASTPGEAAPDLHDPLAACLGAS
ncbi:DNA-binding transcriptional LysR family regulator [Crossiella equi]|uniref:DNA-binding transcriptional LysR family regulator n=1 Tax=Crossiella equi TaxID=130796 RepID=A0ABS5A6V0_9PSEU|nr:LysR family transcriptional regulator [Crossiella equi]MBP2472321.1 DNA-binding transcriptional LysR family regulator [Crossiella equi]